MTTTLRFKRRRIGGKILGANFFFIYLSCGPQINKNTLVKFEICRTCKHGLLN
jgi:hypothetical protein